MTAFQTPKCIVTDDNSAFPIGTDALALALGHTFEIGETVLDLAAGCGIVGVLLQNKFPKSAIFALEIDPDTHAECQSNYTSAAISNQNVILGSFCDKSIFEENKFKTIACNPPFFTNGASSPNDRRAKARHITIPDLQQMLHSVRTWLDTAGNYICIIPAISYSIWVSEALLQGLFLRSIQAIQNFEHTPIDRFILEFTRIPSVQIKQNDIIVLYDQPNRFTKSYLTLVQNYLCVPSYSHS